MEEVEEASENWKYQETRLSASWASRNPVGTVKADIEKMARNRMASRARIGLSKDDHIGVIGCRMKSDREPQAACPPQRETPEQAVERDRERIDPAFVLFEEKMDEAKKAR